MTTVAARATSAADAAAVAPAATTSSTGPRLRLCTTSRWPALIRFFAMGLPMTPSPINPIVSLMSNLLKPPLGSDPDPDRGQTPFQSLQRIILPRLQIMKRAFLVLALVGAAVSPLVAGGKGTVTGEYVEARTAEVFTGGCIMNSEAETM